MHPQPPEHPDHHDCGLALDLLPLRQHALHRCNMLRWQMATGTMSVGAGGLTLAAIGGRGAEESVTAVGHGWSLMPIKTEGPAPGAGAHGAHGRPGKVPAPSGMARHELHARIAGVTGVAQVGNFKSSSSS